MHIVIIGSGSAAFAAAIQAASLGGEVTIIEKGVLGGTCVNVGCVPSKIFIRAAEAAHLQTDHPFAGLKKMILNLDRAALSRQQQDRVDELRHAKYESILESNEHIRLIQGVASFKDSKTIVIDMPGNKHEEIMADKILIATGSRPFIPNIPGLDQTPYWTSTEALQSDVLPKTLAVIGGSVVAVELAQAFSRLGSNVTILARSTLLSKADPALGEGLKSAFESEGIEVLNQTVPNKISYDGKQFHLELMNRTITVDNVLVAAGRLANTEELALDRAGVDVALNGSVIVNETMQTNISHIYSAGDCTTLPKYVYVAAAAASRAAANMFGADIKLDLSIMPSVIFTDPQVATVGLTDEQAKIMGIEAESRLLTLDYVPRALVGFDTKGFMKLVAEKGTGRLLGAQFLAHEGGEAIQTIVMALQARMTIKDLSRQLFPYLTMVEGIKLCAQTFTKNAKELSCCAETTFDKEDMNLSNDTTVAAENKSACCAKDVKLTNTGTFGVMVQAVTDNPVKSALFSFGLFATGLYLLNNFSDTALEEAINEMRPN